ncbi:MAG: MNIO family bufferin maturase [Pseudomonas sp.]
MKTDPPLIDPNGAPAHGAGLPARAGLGLKPQHYREILDTAVDLGFFEIHAENYMVDGGPFHHYLGLIRERYPLSLHGVGLSIGAEGPLDEAHLERLASLLERYCPQAFSEHLAWSSHGDLFLNDLLPLAYDDATLARVCEHIDRVQSRLRRRMLLENPATYLEFACSSMDETTFLCEVVRRTGCGLLLDVTNAYVSSINHQRDAYTYINALPLSAVGEIHLAGFAEDRDGAGDRLLIDSHGAPVADPVWALYAQVLQLIGPTPTLIERVNQVPALDALLAEARQAERLLMGSRPLRQQASA